MDEIKQAQDKLWGVLINYPFFSDKILPNPYLHKSLIAYVDYMDEYVLKAIPDQIDDFSVVVHFIGSIDDKHSAKIPTPKSFKSLENMSEFNMPEVFDM